VFAPGGVRWFAGRYQQVPAGGEDVAGAGRGPQDRAVLGRAAAGVDVADGC